VSGYLGRLVSSELTRRKAWPVQDVEPDASDVAQALEALAEVRASIDELDEIAGRLARTATAYGASWEDVAGRLKLPADMTETAFGRGEGGRQ